MYERPRINVKVEPRSTITFTRGLSYLPLLYLRAFAQKNYASVEVNPDWPDQSWRHDGLLSESGWKVGG